MSESRQGRQDKPAPPCTPDGHGHCVICGDEGIVARITSIDAMTGTAIALVDGEPRDVALDFVHNVVAGDRVLIHLGFAIARLEPADQ